MTAQASPEHFDVVVIGGGPGGSTAGTYLTRAGMSVLILEREKFPRFHIGESMLPHSNDIFRELGVWPALERAGFMRKLGADFATANGGRFQRFWFRDGLGSPYAQTFQVERSRFDEILLDHAAGSGCTVRQEARASELNLGENETELTYLWRGEQRRARCRWLIDATGRDTFVGKKLGMPRIPTQSDRRIATYAHYRGVGRNEGDAAGNITIYRINGGWFWFIPLDAEKTSVGFVQRNDDAKASGLGPDERLAQIITSHGAPRVRMQNAEMIGDVHTTADYSYCFENFSPHPRVLFAGDAAGFTDPIFSSGVMLALKSGRLAARAISKAESERRAALPASVRRAYTKEVRRMMTIYVKLIDAFYDDPSFEIFMHPVPKLDIARAVLAVVGGLTEMPFALRWRLWVFHFLARLQRRFQIAPKIDFAAEQGKPRTPAPVAAP